MCIFFYARFWSKFRIHILVSATLTIIYFQQYLCAFFFMPDFGQNSGYYFLLQDLFTKFYYARFQAKLFFISSNRWCVCMDHEDFEKLCVIAFRIVAATHKEDCTCQCAFCDICHTLDYLSISWLMEHLLCPVSRRFPNSSFKLYDWACISSE